MGGYSAYPEYKDSGIEWLGKIPKHWSQSVIGYYFYVQLGKMLQNEPESIHDEENFYLKALHVQWDKINIDKLPKMWVPPREKEKYSVRNGDLLICEGGEVGRTNLLIGIKEDCIIQNALHRVRPSKQSSVEYLNYLMRHIADANWFDLLCNKATISHLTSEKLRAIAFPVPPLFEQEQIARFLDYKTAQIDALIAKKEALLEKLSEKRTALITQAVTKGLDPNVPMKDSGIEWLGKIPKDWKMSRMKYYATCFNGSTPRTTDPEYWENGEIPWLSSNKVNDKIVDKASAYISKKALQECSLQIAPKGSSIVGIVGQGKTRGLSSYLNIDTTINQNMVAIVPNQYLEGRFLYYFLQQAYQSIRNLGRGANQPALDTGLINELPIPIPSLTEQQEIVQYLEQQEIKFLKTTKKIKEAIQTLKEYRTALITNAVTGKIDVRDIKIPYSEEVESHEHQLTEINS